MSYELTGFDLIKMSVGGIKLSGRKICCYLKKSDSKNESSLGSSFVNAHQILCTETKSYIFRNFQYFSIPYHPSLIDTSPN